MPIPRNAQSNAGATRDYSAGTAVQIKNKQRRKQREDKRCPKCNNIHTVGQLNTHRQIGNWYYCRACCLEFNPKTSAVRKVTNRGGVEEL